MADKIFDVGAHTGRDTGFYLAKGFDVVAVEANPDLAAALAETFAPAVRDGRLTIVTRAIADGGGEVRFYVNDDKPDWSSVVEKAGRRHGGRVREIVVPAVTMRELVGEHGAPYYCKIDIEGGDTLCLRQLRDSDGRPPFLSFEAELNNPEGLEEQIAHVSAMGYSRFQVVNQRDNRKVRPPRPAREGAYVDARFDGHCSALFGRELEPRAWLDFDGLRRRLDHLRRWNIQLGSYDRPRPGLLDKARAAGHLVLGLPVGWYDIHAARA